MKTKAHKKAQFTPALIILAVSIIILPGCKEKADTSPIRIAINPWPGYEFLHLADKKGFFKDESVPIQLVRFSALEDARLAYERGQVDGMTSTVVEVLQAYEHGRDAKIVLIADFSYGADVLIARKGINSVLDLKGKKVAIEADSLGIFFIARALETAGGSLDDVQIETMSMLNTSQALLDGEIDAMHTYPPYSTDLMKYADRVNKIFDSTEIPGEIVDIVSLDPDIVAHRPNDVRALRRAWDKALAYARANPEESNKIMADLEGISAEDFSAALQGAKVLGFSEQKPLMAEGGAENAADDSKAITPKKADKILFAGACNCLFFSPIPLNNRKL